MTSVVRNPLTVLRGSYALKVSLLLALVVVAVALIGGSIYLETSDALEANTRDTLESSAKLQAGTLAEATGRATDTAYFVAGSSVVASGDSSEIGAYLSEENDQLIDSQLAIHYVDSTTGSVLASSADNANGAEYGVIETASARDADGAGEATATLTSPFTDPVTGKSVVGVLAPIQDSSDRAILLLLDLEAQSNHLGKPAESAFTHVVNDEGTVVFSHRTGKIGEQNMGPNDVQSVDSMGVKRGLEGKTGYAEMEMGGETMTMGYAPVEGTDWVIMTHVPAKDAFALRNEISTLLGALVGVSILGLAIVGVVFGQRTSTSLDRLSTKAHELESGNLDTELETDRRDEIGQLYDSFDSMRDSLRATLTDAQEARQNAEHRSEELAALATHLEEKAAAFDDVMAAAAAGDLTARMDETSKNEAMQDIASEYNEMIADLSATVDDLSAFANDVAANSEQVTASAEEVRGASQQVTESIQQISDDTDLQHEQFQSVQSAMADVSSTTEEIASLSTEVATLAGRSADIGERGRDDAESAIEAMERIDERSKAAVAEFDRLRETVSEIEAVAEFIGEIAGQTNMLALNANIEASRGGGNDDAAGEGFAVVAGQVKDLAADTKESAEEIEDLVRAVDERTDRTAAELERTSEEIAESTDVVRDAASALDEIAGYARETHDGVEEISASTEEQASSTEEVVAMMGEAESVSERVANEAENVAAAAEEQTTALTEVTSSASGLASKARHLQEELDRFETVPAASTDASAN